MLAVNVARNPPRANEKIVPCFYGGIGENSGALNF